MKKSTLLHLRIPFSFFLMPVFLFALSQAGQINVFTTTIAFIAIHLFIYPASNGFNSFFDKDEDSIGGLKSPPPVTHDLYKTSLLFDLIGVGLGIFVSIEFAAMLVLYGLASKAYSHPSIRLKKYPWLSWLVIGLFQGSFTYFMSYLAIHDAQITDMRQEEILDACAISALLLLGAYPMTQIYQHAEDKRRGDNTLSLVLGIRGTFLFTAFIFFLANVGFNFYFLSFKSWKELLVFQVFVLPVFAYFIWWFLKVLKDPTQANFKSTMMLNYISSICMCSAFLVIFIMQRV